MRDIIPLLDLRFLNIVCYEPEDLSWAGLFASLRNLKSVELQYHPTVQSFIAALNAAGAPEETGPQRYDQDANPIPLPSLNSLSLEFIEFEDDNLLDELIDLLIVRDKRGYRLPVLCIYKLPGWLPHSTDRWVAKLSPLVDKLKLEDRLEQYGPLD